MYESFYGLREKPFNLTPDPKFLYLSKKHKEAFAHLLYGIRNRSGFVEITGEVGTGKTTICRTLLEQVGPEVEIAFIFNPYLSATELLRAINEDFGIKSSAVTKKELIDELNAHLLKQRQEGKNCVILIDEAQDLSAPVLEQIRLLSNLETDTEKLLQIVLVGQPELKEHLTTPEMRQLDQRITARYHLKPLDKDEIVGYVGHRIARAGGRGKIRFTRGALKVLYKYSGGTPRLINAVCDRALLIGYTREKKEINSAIIKQAIKEVEGEKVKIKRKDGARRPRRARAAVFAAVAVLVLLAGGYYYVFEVLPGGWSGLLAGLTESKETTPEAVQEEVPPEPVEPEVPVTDPERELEGQFMEFLRSLAYRTAKRDCALGMLESWDIRRERLPSTWGTGFIDLFETAGVAGLRCTASRGDLEKLKRIGLPCILELYLPGDEKPVYAFVEELREKDGREVASVSPGTDEAKEFPFEWLERYWYGRTFYYWRDFERVPEILALNVVGDGVRWLQTQLLEMGVYEGEATGTYDQATMQAVIKFQQEYRLDDDGIAGPNTRMAMYSVLDKYETPKLAAEPEHSAPQEEA
jgi:general secretion pathway protein A